MLICLRLWPALQLVVCTGATMLFVSNENPRPFRLRKPLSAAAAIAGFLMGCSGQPSTAVDASGPHIISVNSPNAYGLYAGTEPDGNTFKGELIDIIFSGLPHDSAPTTVEALPVGVVVGKCGQTTLAGVLARASASNAPSAGDMQAELLLAKYGSPDTGRCAAVYAVGPGDERVFLGELQQGAAANNPERAWLLVPGAIEPQSTASPTPTL